LSDEEETYYTIFTALRHPIRRRILRMLAKEPMTFTETLNRLKIESSHLTYHLESLGVLISKTENGRYRLSTFGGAAVSMMGWVEEAPKTEPKPATLTTTWKAIVILLVVGFAVFAGAYYSQYHLLTQVYMDYTTMSADYAHMRDDYVNLWVNYNQTIENYDRTREEYNRTLADYAALLENLAKYPPLDLPAYL
jgi:DNA-binding transcriptional ArsR family regulator